MQAALQQVFNSASAPNIAEASHVRLVRKHFTEALPVQNSSSGRSGTMYNFNVKLRAEQFCSDTRSFLEKPTLVTRHSYVVQK